ncbi:MAG: hypothetical protein MUE96_12565 [Bacteroidia bacterium]|jgi:hypothetical protein|nr:hypothetical protein [Bacteroidia bacterium]
MAVIKNKKAVTKQKGVSADTKLNVDVHKKAAKHHETAAIYHLEAASFHEVGEHEKAHHSSIVANGHSLEARNLEKQDVKQHAAIPS